ncbi:hypothetical protein ACFRFQ_09515 [Rhodococcus sp. NPDC056743]|uniref:hypothetical protein n=1 Tax=Rhodococcus sp. NPDC056743 TaxID=3345934 RepID=UPI00366AB2A9
MCVKTIDKRTHERTLLGGIILIGVNAAAMANVLHLVADAVLSSGHDVAAYEFGISNANGALPRSTV